ESTLFRRPMGLTPSELGALELGLAALARELPPHEAAVAERARGRVVEASTGLAPEVARVPALAGTLVTSEQDGLHLSQLRTAIAGHRKVTLQYMSGSSAAGADRSVHPYGLVHARGHWYLIGYCDRAMSIRIFRLDRITDVTVLDAEANIPPNMDLEATLHDGMPLVNSAEEVLRVQYSAAIARWIAEQQAVDAQPDGSVIAEYPLLDDEWAVRHVLQYGPDAEVLEPARIRTMVCERLAAILASA
ncbi:MAG TPA: WYL domain-containing protein, partial [Gemmatimonadaceae bacterium]